MYKVEEFEVAGLEDKINEYCKNSFEVVSVFQNGRMHPTATVSVLFKQIPVYIRTPFFPDGNNNIALLDMKTTDCEGVRLCDGTELPVGKINFEEKK